MAGRESHTVTVTDPATVDTRARALLPSSQGTIMSVMARTAAPLSQTPSLWTLAGLVLLCLTVGWAGSFITTSQIPTWYAALSRPAWTPPNWLFAPVWTTLYVLMGIAGWRVAHPSAPGHRAWPVWWIQLVLNGIWTPLFFGAHQVALALVVILALAVTIGLFIRATWSRDRFTALLFVPYLVWISYASSLNAAILWLN
jgi:benzodiazapine receptor